MRIALFSDIHGNLPALEAVLEHIRAQPFDAVYCLGDLVGYAPFPNEVTERIRQECIPTIMGNYDDGVGFERDECGCAYREADEKKRGNQMCCSSTSARLANRRTVIGEPVTPPWMSHAHA
jgi:predicted phosphodiesterase